MDRHLEKLEEAALATRLADNLCGIFNDMREELAAAVQDTASWSAWVQRIRSDGSALETRANWHRSFTNITGLLARLGLTPPDLQNIESDLDALIVRWKNFAADDEVDFTTKVLQLQTDTPPVRRFLA